MNKKILNFGSALAVLGILAAAPSYHGCDDDDDDDVVGCPSGMVGYDSDEGAMCIDATEFTNSAYAEFLNGYGNACEDHECMHTEEPGSRIGLAESDDGGAEVWLVDPGYEAHPVVRVTFHGALAACEESGKTLCTESAWRSACGGAGGSAYPYGDSYSSEACNSGEGSDEGAPVSVASMPGCEGGVEGLFDMSGNVYEWVATCASGPCNIAGGSYDKTSEALSCGAVHEMDGPSGHREDLGFRCCAAR